MYRYAQIINNKVHHIMEHEADSKELYEKYFSSEIVFIDITNKSDIQEGWDYDGINFIAPAIYVPTETEKLAQYRQQRDVLLTNTDKLYILPDYTIAGKPLTPEQRQELIDYRRALRDAPEKSYPDWPVVPAWLPKS